MLTRATPEPKDRGNVLLTMPVLMVVVLLAAAMFARSHLALDRSRTDTDDARATAAAELAVHEAFARIDAGETARFSGSGSVDGTDFEYTASPRSAASWDIAAEATSTDFTRALAAVISREPQHAHSLFVVGDSSFDRNTGRITGRVGTNGAMTVTGPSPGSQQELYRPDGSCRGCTNATTLDGPRAIDPVEAPVGPTQPCPPDGTFTGVVDGRSGVAVVCDDPATDVEFVGDVTIVNPPLIVYVGSEVPLVLDTARINRPGPAADFQLFVDGVNTDAVSDISATDTRLDGLVHAPGRSIRTDDLEVVGSLTLDELTVPRRGRVAISADTSLESLGSTAWRIVSLQRVR